MKRMIKAIVKRTDEPYGHVAYISNTLKNFQKTVGGHIETISIGKTVIICNEEGKLRGLDQNFAIKFDMGEDIIFGDVVVVGAAGEDFDDCPMDFSTWKDLLEKWGN